MFNWIRQRPSTDKALDAADNRTHAVLAFTPTMNSIEVSIEKVAASSHRVRANRTLCSSSPSGDPVERLYAMSMQTYMVSCSEEVSEWTPLNLRLVWLDTHFEHEEDHDDSDSDSDDEKKKQKKGEDSIQLDLTLTVDNPSVAWHFLPAGRPFAVIVQPQATDAFEHRTDMQTGDVVEFANGRQRCLGLVTKRSLGQQMHVEVLRNTSIDSKDIAEARESSVLARNALLVFNTHTLPGLQGPSAKVTKNFVLPRDRLGAWLLGLRGNYSYAASLGDSFVVELLEHGLFVLPGKSQIFACPFPETPFIFKLQEQKGRPNARSWQSCKMMKRHGKQFELSCNQDFRAHLRRCGEYHEERGGTWINAPLIELLIRIHKDQGNKIRMYCFELWDRATGELAAASFGLRIGVFFHDFSMCCLVKDCRSAGSILTKAIGALLTDCGVMDWYWGCKVPYMAEYEKHGAIEVPRKEYYERLRRGIHQDVSMDPCDAIAAGRAVIQCRASSTL